MERHIFKKKAGHTSSPTSLTPHDSRSAGWHESHLANGLGLWPLSSVRPPLAHSITGEQGSKLASGRLMMTCICIWRSKEKKQPRVQRSCLLCLDFLLDENLEPIRGSSGDEGQKAGMIRWGRSEAEEKMKSVNVGVGEREDRWRKEQRQRERNKNWQFWVWTAAGSPVSPGGPSRSSGRTGDLWCPSLHPLLHRGASPGVSSGANVNTKNTVNFTAIQNKLLTT